MLATSADTERGMGLLDDARLHCVEDTPERSFWIYWGEPARESRYGIVCFGDFELRQLHTLIVTAMSDLRMRMLLDLVRGTGVTLPAPRIQRNRVQVMDKRTGKVQLMPPPGKKKRS